MKTKLLIILFFLSLMDLTAQSIYVPGKVTKGKTAAYYCKAKNEWLLEVRNVNNVDTTDKMYYNDGRVVPNDVDLGGRVATGPEDLMPVLQEILTLEERNKLKTMYVYYLGLTVVADSQGNTQEIIFQFRNTDPFMANFDPDRLYQLEQKLKKILKMYPSKSDTLIRNIKYIQVIRYKDMK